MMDYQPAKQFMIRSASTADLIPFQFLALPKDIRSMIYDLLASTNTRNYVIHIRDNYSLKVVVQRMRGPKILQTCRYIKDKATVLHEQLKATKAEPTRLLLHWRNWSTLPVLAALQCAETNAETTTPFGHKKSRVHPPCDLSSHEEFLQLFRSGHTPNKIELAMECDKDLDCRLFQLNSFHSRFDNWLSAQDLDLDLTIRLAPVDATTRGKLEKLQASMKDAGVKLLDGKNWKKKYVIGEWVLEQAWQEKWISEVDKEDKRRILK